jgi:DNA-binding PadR family transcriptional regulator
MLDLTLLQLKVLWLINKKDSCGYEMMCTLGRGKKKITQGTMYPLLQSLEREGWIESKTSGKRGKKYYSTTPAGKKVLQNACKEFCKIYNDIFKEFVCEVCGRKA